ncbi:MULTISPECIES: hypothetical protein [unclassified Thermoanaerobacterium]|uniref:hypothetical protein n=1 Tax=unclassified Thermoanaerobacterium TaxID=2622527 RepID=UPI000A151330|nr:MULTISPECIES: hypothetical protein [unclassified Thermoanaerobacterium]MDE4543029.1 hypothetical protein [Thermoanaerobacterium sp. R66]ORX22813.1 hypothetical protein BVF91_10075 [Thermoanaerobacterium sp. PSU-2]HHV74582.1 hypothetical protein [Thermoanaerobacterium sp.]
MEILQSELKIENLIKETEHIFEKLMSFNEILSNDVTKIDAKLEKSEKEIKEYIESQFEENNDRKYLISYLRKADNRLDNLKEIENMIYSNIDELGNDVKTLKDNLDNMKKTLYKLKDLERDISSMKAVIEKDVLLNIELNKENTPEKVEYVYDLPPQLVNNLNTALNNLYIAREGMNRIKIYEDIVNNLENFQ